MKMEVPNFRDHAGSKDMADFLNKAEYATKMSEYDRDMLKKFQKLVKKVEEEEAKLNKEYEELHTLQASLTEKQTAVEKLLTEKVRRLRVLNPR
mgnify:CR=1 FL=1